MIAAVPNARSALGLDWRFSELGEARTPRGPSRVVWRDGAKSSCLSFWR